MFILETTSEADVRLILFSHSVQPPHLPRLAKPARTNEETSRFTRAARCLRYEHPHLKKRKRPTHEQMLDITKKHKAAMTKRLELAEARIEALKMEIKVTEAAEMIMGLKAKSKAAKAKAAK